MSDSELDSILKQLDLDNNDKVNYSEFLAATVDFSKHATLEKIRAMFEIFDIQGSGEISRQNIKDAFTKFG
jgi:Ca2+-binding EF-hand superfamily protein